MFKLILRLLFLIIFGFLAYDIGQTWSFNKSQTYQFLREKKFIEKGEVVFTEAKKSYNKIVIWIEKNIPVYFNETCFHLKPYVNLGQDMSLVFRSNVISFIQHAGIYVDKNFPIFQDYMSIVLKDTISSAQGTALAISQNLQNYAETIVQYASSMFCQR